MLGFFVRIMTLGRVRLEDAGEDLERLDYVEVHADLMQMRIDEHEYVKSLEKDPDSGWGV